MAEFHFVEDYERHVAHLIATMPLDEAMSLAVGGAYDAIGAVERDIMRWAGLRDGMAVLDFGCGSGRLGSSLGRSFSIDYLGLDIVQSLLDYARSRCPNHFRFALNRSRTIPAADAWADMISSFSVFTHLLHSETYLYLEEMRQVLKPGGRIVMSFLEFASPAHWEPFIGEVNNRREHAGSPLNTMIERPVIDLWCDRLGLVREHFVDGDDAPWGLVPLGQSVAVLRKL